MNSNKGAYLRHHLDDVNIHSRPFSLGSRKRLGCFELRDLIYKNTPLLRGVVKKAYGIWVSCNFVKLLILVRLHFVDLHIDYVMTESWTLCKFWRLIGNNWTRGVHPNVNYYYLFFASCMDTCNFCNIFIYFNFEPFKAY